MIPKIVLAASATTHFVFTMPELPSKAGAIPGTLLPLINQSSLPASSPISKELDPFMVSSAPGINPAVLAAVESTNAEEILP